MKKIISEFFRRGLIACGFGPLVLAIVYIILKNCADLEMLSVSEVYTGIISISALAFISGAINTIYQIERLPLMVAILIHGIVLYVSYLTTYLINSWLDKSLTTVLIFTAIFIIGYLITWAVIYFVTMQNTKKLNEKLKKKQHLSA